MTTIIIISIIGCIAYWFITATKVKQPSTNFDSSSQIVNKNSQPFHKEMNETNKLKTSEIPEVNNIDDSVIDVTGQFYVIVPEDIPKVTSKKPPIWKHKYIYSFSDLESASKEQKAFYSIFKISFINNEYIDLEGNTNYAFILLFDLLQEYDRSKDLLRLETLLARLGEQHPKTRPYCLRFLEKRVEATQYVSTFQIQGYEHPDWRLGSKYKNKLQLSKDDIDVLDRIIYSHNSFSSIEFCCIEIIKLYVNVMKELRIWYLAESTNLEDEFSLAADVIVRKHFKYRKGSKNYTDAVIFTVNQFYNNILKHCENTVRDAYDHKRKLSIDIFYSHKEAIQEFEYRIGNKISILTPIAAQNISPIDEDTEIELSMMNPNRWKIKFEQISETIESDINFFINSIFKLGIQNSKNPSIENIFLEASKKIAKYDNKASIIFYIHYIYHDLKSTSFNNKKLGKNIQKILFRNDEQLNTFEKIIDDFIENKDFTKALDSVSSIYETKRKKIELDKGAIKAVQEQHSGTVELLNEYLQENSEDTSDVTNVLLSDREKSDNLDNLELVNQLVFEESIALNSVQIYTLNIFQENSLKINKSELEPLLKSKGVFMNQIIESINEICYDILDDILIEEDDEFYTIIPEYFQTILIK